MDDDRDDEWSQNLKMLDHRPLHQPTRPPRAAGDTRIMHDILEGESSGEDVSPIEEDSIQEQQSANVDASMPPSSSVISFPDADSGPSFCRFEEDKWLDEVEEGHLQDDHSWCFLCEYSQDVADVDGNPDYARLLSLIQKNYGKTRPIALCRMIQMFYRERLMNCIEEPRDWTLASIYYHIERHRPEPITMTLDAVRTITSAIHLLKDHGMCAVSSLPDGTRQRSLHVGNTRLFLTLVDRQQKLLGALARLGHTYSKVL